MAKKKAAKNKRHVKVLQPLLSQDLPQAPPQATEPPSYDIKEISAAVASLTTVVKPILTKLCRLCESKDGPYLNIFESDKILAKKINRLLPLVIDEYDKLPHKICFRCSAKVEELHEFVERCIRTQENLKKSLGESKWAIARKNWEEKLKESRTTNDDYCESLVKQALEKIGVVPDNHPPEMQPPPTKMSQLGQTTESLCEIQPPKIETPPSPPPQQKKRSTRNKAPFSFDIEIKEDDKLPSMRSSRSRNELVALASEELTPKVETLNVKETKGRRSKMKVSASDITIPESKQLPTKDVSKVNSLVGMVIKEKNDVSKQDEKVTVESDDDVTITEYKKQEDLIENYKKNLKLSRVKGQTNGAVENVIKQPVPVNKPEEGTNETGSDDSEDLDKMQHISTIKVGGAGLLYQCKLCKRNFLKKEVVLGHNCARARLELAKVKKPEPTPQPIKQDLKTTHNDIIQQALAQKLQPKPLTDKEIIEAFKVKNMQNLSINSFSMDPQKSLSKAKPGPASKKKNILLTSNTAPPPTPALASNLVPAPNPSATPIPTAATTHLALEIPAAILSSKNRFKLVPGPNNTYTLIEDTQFVDTIKKSEDLTKAQQTLPQARSSVVKIKTSNASNEIIDIDDDRIPEITPPITPRNIPTYNRNYPNLSSAEMGNYSNHQQMPLSLPTQATTQESIPYPVGLFQTLPRSQPPQVPTFSTPAMKKQSYAIVQTGHPSKLVLSTKPQQPPVPVPTVSQKQKKGKKIMEPTKQPFQVTLEDSTPQKAQGDGFFTFVNVDPLLQPSYVLPTTNIQESQITTSTAPIEQNKKVAAQPEVYKCELCHMQFTREKKLLTHLQTHYVQIDEDEDYHPTPKKKPRKS